MVSVTFSLPMVAMVFTLGGEVQATNTSSNGLIHSAGASVIPMPKRTVQPAATAHVSPAALIPFPRTQRLRTR